REEEVAFRGAGFEEVFRGRVIEVDFTDKPRVKPATKKILWKTFLVFHPRGGAVRERKLSCFLLWKTSFLRVMTSTHALSLRALSVLRGEVPLLRFLLHRP